MGMGWTRPLTPEEQAERDATVQQAGEDSAYWLGNPGYLPPPIKRTPAVKTPQGAGALPGGIPTRLGEVDLNPLGLPPMRDPSLKVPTPAPEAPKPSPMRAVRMPDGKIVFTNLGAAEGGTVLDEGATQQAAEGAGFMRSPNPPPIEPAQLPDTIGAAGDPSYRRLFDRDNNLANVQNRELVERADAAQRAGRHGNASVMELKPGDDGLGTPGFYHAQEQQADDQIGSLDRRAAVADAAAKVKQAEEWAKMTPEQRRAAVAQSEAAKRPNFNLQIIEHLQGQLAELDRRAASVKEGIARQFPNTDNPDTARLRAQAEQAALAEIDAQRQRIIQVGGLPFKADPYGLLGAGQQDQGSVQGQGNPVQR